MKSYSYTRLYQKVSRLQLKIIMITPVNNFIYNLNLAIILFRSICSNLRTSIPQKFCRHPLLGSCPIMPAISFVLYLQSQSGTPSASDTWTSRYMSRGHRFWLSSKSWRTMSVAMWYIFRLCMRNSCKTTIDFSYVRNRELNSIWHLITLSLFWEINFLTKYTVRLMYAKTLRLVYGKEWPVCLNVQMLLGFNGFSLSYSDFKSTGLQTHHLLNKVNFLNWFLYLIVSLDALYKTSF